MKCQLQALDYPKCAVQEVVDDIFGCQQGNTFSEGLVESSNEEEFSQKLEVLEERWNELEKAHGAQVGFYDWFI